MTGRPIAITNVRLVDPASGYDGPGAVLVTEGVIADVAQGAGLGKLSPDVEVIASAPYFLRKHELIVVGRRRPAAISTAEYEVPASLQRYR